jgi:hypothetical protein
MNQFRRALGVSLTTALGVVALNVAGAASASATVGAKPAASTSGTAAAHKLVALAKAYGTRVSGSVLVSSGPTAPVSLGACSANTTGPLSASVVSVNLAPVGTTGTITDTAAGSVTKSGNTSVATSTVQTVSLLSGLISAEAVGSTSSSTFASGTYSPQGSTDLVGLEIGGQSIGASPPANTTLALPGVGSVTLNQQKLSGTSMTVNAIAVSVTKKNALGLPLGVKIVIGHSVSGFATAAPVEALLEGHAYGTQARVGTVVSSGQTAPITVACLGTGGKTHTTNVVGVSLPGALSTGTVTSTGEGETSSTTAQVTTTDTIEAVNLLSSLVSAQAVTASAEATDNAGAITTSDAGSGFVGLSVAGFPGLGDNIPANTQLSLPGIGTLYLHRVIAGPKGIEVRMIELVITSSLGPLPVGTDIRVAVASARIR